MKNLLFIFLFFGLKAASQTAFPLYIPANPDSIKQVVNVNGAPRQVYNIDLVKYRAALTARDTAAALRLLIAGNTSTISANMTAIGLKADKSATISINGTSQTLGSNPSFTISGGGTSSSNVAWYNVKNYGAKGDGTTNDVDSINAVINTASTAGGGVVYLPKGTYIVQAAYITTNTYKPAGIILKSNVTLLGEGKDVTIIKLADQPAGITSANGTFNTVISGTSISNSTIRDLTVNGNQANNQATYTTNPYASQGKLNNVLFTGGSDNSVINVKSINGVSNGVAFIANSLRGTIDKCYLSDNASAGAIFYGGSTYGVIRNSISTRNLSDNIRLQSDYCSAINNEASYAQFTAANTANFAGIYAEDVRGITITGNYTHDNSAYGIDVAQISDTTNTTLSTAALIQGNTTSFNGNAGIQVASNQITIVGNNVVNNCRTSFGAQDSIHINLAGINLGAVNGIIISGNKIRSTRGIETVGIRFPNSTPANLHIASNEISGIPAIFSTSPSMTTNTVFGNTLKDAAGVFTAGNWPDASPTVVSGMVNTLAQSFAGAKTFTDNLTVSKNQNAGTQIVISNGTAATGAQAALSIQGSGGSASSVFKNTSGTTPYKTQLASDFGLYNGGAGDISIGNDYASGKVKLTAGGHSTPDFTLNANGSFSIPATNAAAGTTSAQTINKAAGSINIAGGSTSATVTNSFVTTASNVFLQVEGSDATATSARVTKAAGSFTISLNAAATAETRISFWVIN